MSVIADRATGGWGSSSTAAGSSTGARGGGWGLAAMAAPGGSGSGGWGASSHQSVPSPPDMAPQQLNGEIKRQIEYYFGDANLYGNEHMFQLTSSAADTTAAATADTHQAWVPLAELVSWPKMQSLQAETGLSSGADFLERLQRVMQTSREVQVKQVLGVEGPDHGDGALCARRVRPLQPPPPLQSKNFVPSDARLLLSQAHAKLVAVQACWREAVAREAEMHSWLARVGGEEEEEEQEDVLRTTQWPAAREDLRKLYGRVQRKARDLIHGGTWTPRDAATGELQETKYFAGLAVLLRRKHEEDDDEEEEGRGGRVPDISAVQSQKARQRIASAEMYRLGADFALARHGAAWGSPRYSEGGGASMVQCYSVSCARSAVRRSWRERQEPRLVSWYRPGCERDRDSSNNATQFWRRREPRLIGYYRSARSMADHFAPARKHVRAAIARVEGRVSRRPSIAREAAVLQQQAALHFLLARVELALERPGDAVKLIRVVKGKLAQLNPVQRQVFAAVPGCRGDERPRNGDGKLDSGCGGQHSATAATSLVEAQPGPAGNGLQVSGELGGDQTTMTSSHQTLARSLQRLVLVAATTYTTDDWARPSGRPCVLHNLDIGIHTALNKALLVVQAQQGEALDGGSYYDGAFTWRIVQREVQAVLAFSQDAHSGSHHR
jgi:hypothetical protein